VGDVKLNLANLMKAKDTSVTGLTKGVEFLFKKNNVEYIKGTGSFADENTVVVNLNDGGETSVRGKNIIIATGSESTPFPGLTIDEKKVVTSTGAIALQEIPKKMIVIGGGIIGLEMVCSICYCHFETVADQHYNRVPSGHGLVQKSRSLNSLVRLVVRGWTLRSPR